MNEKLWLIGETFNQNEYLITICIPNKVFQFLSRIFTYLKIFLEPLIILLLNYSCLHIEYSRVFIVSFINLLLHSFTRNLLHCLNIRNWNGDGPELSRSQLLSSQSKDVTFYPQITTRKVGKIPKS